MLDLNFDSTPILTWLDQARAKNELSLTDLRRSLIARMIWKVSYQRSIGLIENVRFLLGSRVWGDRPRAVLAEDILVLRRALAAAGHRLAYSRQPEMNGFYVRGRPLIDPQMKRRMIGAMAEVDPQQMAILHRMTIAERIEQALSMIETAEGVGVRRLRLRQPQLSEEQAYYMVRQGKVA